MKGGLFYRLGDLGIKIPFYNWYRTLRKFNSHKYKKEIKIKLKINHKIKSTIRQKRMIPCPDIITVKDKNFNVTHQKNLQQIEEK